MVTWFFSAAVLIALALGVLAVWSRRRLGPRIVAVAVAALFIPVAYGAFSELLSRPKPAYLEWLRAQAEDAQVIAADMQEDVAIYLWLKLAGDTEPRYYVLPWSRPLAEQLQKATREAKGRRTDVNMRKPFRRDSEDSEAVFYATPRPPLPAKSQPPNGPLVFNGSRSPVPENRR